ncbi:MULTISPECIES: FecR family protein [Methylomonas]|uniref:Iron dicitrate transport regulator FecR n=1 Tax=Methylomonas koyamae TaxID=702114 RepID=A0A177NCW0_9GAMM|nr:FecR family protein [Methylomonas koyamae]OAI15671.1 hypothetical protein A1355_00565 [Methylomonas koyamae]
MNSPIPPFPQGSPDEQAEYWLALRDSPFYDGEQERRWQAWLAASADNREAWRRAEAFFGRIERIDPAQIVDIQAALRGATGARLEVADRPARRGHSWLVPMAACLLLAACLGWAMAAGWLADFRTGTGEQRRIQLSDGSTVILNTGSSLSVDFSETQRVIRLHGGEAYFKVAADAGRPFEVVSSGGRVRALGTAFDVKHWRDDLAVTVYEHSVRVAFADGETVESLPEGQRVESVGGKAGRPESVNLKQVGAWRERRLVFKEQALQAVVDDLNRYRSGRIVIADPDLARHRVTGVFDANDTEAALAVIEKTLAVAEWRLTDALVILRRR